MNKIEFVKTLEFINYQYRAQLIILVLKQVNDFCKKKLHV